MASRSWLKQKHDDFQKGIRASQLQITWSSEDENSPKKRKLDKNVSKPSTSTLEEQDSPILKENASVYPDSPVIGTCADSSPILSENCKETAPNLSPVLGKRKKYKRKLFKLKQQSKSIEATENLSLNQVKDTQKSSPTTLQNYDNDKRKFYKLKQDSKLTESTESLHLSQIIIDSQKSKPTSLHNSPEKCDINTQKSCNLNVSFLNNIPEKDDIDAQNSQSQKSNLDLSFLNNSPKKYVIDTQKSCNSDLFLNTSPDKYDIETQKSNLDPNNSPSKYGIDEIKTQKVDLPHISQEIATQNENLQNNIRILIDSIDNNESQETSECSTLINTLKTNSTEDTVEEQTTINLINNKQKSKKKRNYKKGGLASQLTKAMQTYQSKVSIWNHEVYLSLKNNTQFITPIEEFEKISLCITEIFEEYGNLLIVCKCMQNEQSNNEICIVIVKANVYKLSIGLQFDLFPPFMQKVILYKSNLVKCYFNVIKLLFFPE